MEWYPFYSKTKNYIYRIVNSDKIIKNIAIVTGGTAIGQLVNTLFSPVITRVYTPEEYGVLSVFSSILLIFSFSSLKYEMTIQIVRDDEEALLMMILSLLILTVVSIFVGASLFINENLILELFNAKNLTGLKYLIPIGIYLQGIFLILSQYMYRKKLYKIVSKTKFSQNLLGNISKVTLGLLGFGGIGLIIGRIISVSVGSIKFYSAMRIKEISKISITKKNILKGATIYKDFPLYQSTSAVIIHLRNQFPILFLAPLYGTEIVGLYGLANIIIKIPMILIGQSVMDVFFAEIASIGKNNPKKIKNLSNSLFKKLAIVGIMPTFLIALAGPFIFATIFGDQWIEAGNFARILSIYIYSNLIFSPISKVFEVFRKQYLKLILDSISLLLIIIIFLLANVFNFEADKTILMYSITMALLYLFTYIAAQILLSKEIKNDKHL